MHHYKYNSHLGTTSLYRCHSYKVVIERFHKNLWKPCHLCLIGCEFFCKISYFIAISEDAWAKGNFVRFPNFIRLLQSFSCKLLKRIE